MKLTYFGKKRPKRIVSKIREGGIKKSIEYLFDPFSVVEVDDKTANILLENAGDIFKRVDKNERAPDPKPEVSTEGYVGGETAQNLRKRKGLTPKQLAEKVKKKEKGKTIDDVKKMAGDDGYDNTDGEELNLGMD